MAYSPPKFQHEITLQLSRNESRCAVVDLDRQLGQLGTAFVSRYPSHADLQSLIAEWVDVPPDRIVVTAGGDEAIDRVMRIALNGERKKIVSHQPSFEMVEVYANNYGGKLDSTQWLEGNFPVESLVANLDCTTALAVVVSPNNPTGGWLTVAQIREIAEAASVAGCHLLVDNAYIEFAAEDPTAELTKIENVIIVRTFSKAWGLAGLRVGYLIAPDSEYANAIRHASGPFPVSAVSLETARRALANYQPAMSANVATIKKMRRLISHLVLACGGRPFDSQGNFILAEFPDAEETWAGLAADGVAVRKFIGSPLLANRLRITCPTSPAEYLQLAKSLCRVHGADFENQKTALGLAWKPENIVVTSAEDPIANTPESNATTAASRTWKSQRVTKETNIELELNLDGSGTIEVDTGIGFLDHMLTALAFHSGMDLKLKCVGDLDVDDHHTSEDCALALGTAIDAALGERTGIKRFGYAYAPLDEALARTVIDLSGRPWPEIHLQLEREMVGQWACENIVHFFQSMAMTLKCSLHVDVLRGTNDHHRAEAAFKSCAKALREAIAKTEGNQVPSTKGIL